MGRLRSEYRIEKPTGKVLVFKWILSTSDYSSNLVTITNDIGLSSVDDDDETGTLIGAHFTSY